MTKMIKEQGEKARAMSMLANFLAEYSVQGELVTSDRVWADRLRERVKDQTSSEGVLEWALRLLSSTID